MKKNEYEKRIAVGATGDVGYGDLSPHLSLDIRKGWGARTDRAIAHYRVKMLMNIFLPRIARMGTNYTRLRVTITITKTPMRCESIGCDGNAV